MKQLKMDYSKQIEDVLTEFTYLTYNKKINCFEGLLCITDDDYYKVLVGINSFPYKFPLVFEIGNRIPKTNDRHIHLQGNCCFTTYLIENMLLNTKIKTLLDFFKEIVIPFFANNSYFEITGKYKFGEYNHDINNAVAQTYADILDIYTPFFIFKTVFDRVFKNITLSENDLCYCGSKLKLNTCKNHLTNYKNFCKINIEYLMLSINHFLSSNIVQFDRIINNLRLNIKKEEQYKLRTNKKIEIQEKNKING